MAENAKVCSDTIAGLKHAGNERVVNLLFLRKIIDDMQIEVHRVHRRHRR